MPLNWLLKWHQYHKCRGNIFPCSVPFFITHITSKSCTYDQILVYCKSQGELAVHTSESFFWKFSRMGNRAEQDRLGKLNLKPIIVLPQAIEDKMGPIPQRSTWKYRRHNHMQKHLGYHARVSCLNINTGTERVN